MGESPGLPPNTLVGDLIFSSFFFNAFLCHFFSAFDVCSSNIDLFIVDPIYVKKHVTLINFQSNKNYGF